MIKIITDLPTTAFNNALYVKISSLYNAYGTGQTFCCFWKQLNSENKITAIICKFYSAITICASKNADKCELNEFINTIGCSEVLSNVQIENDYCKFNSVYSEANGNGNYNFEIDYISAKKCYDILNQYPDEIQLGCFDDWYVDISHRIRHNSAFIINHSNSTALCLLGRNNVLINGIAVDSKCIKSGLGRKIINKIFEIPIKGVFAICSENNVGFYLRSGFKLHEKIYYKGKY